MALVFMESFDLTNGISFRNWSTTGNAIDGNSFTYQTGDISGSCFRVRTALRFGQADNGTVAYMYRTLPTTYSESIIGFRAYFSPWIGVLTDSFFRFYDSGLSSIPAQIVANSTTGVLSVQNGGGTTIATGITNVLPGWHYIELRIKINGASGECELNLDGATEIATTVGNFGSTNIGSLLWIAVVRGGSLNAVSFDDIYVLDTTGGAPLNTFLGDSHIYTVLPTSDGANADWTPNSGVTGYTQVDDNPYDGDTTYVSASTPGDISTFGFADLPFASGTVYAIQPNLMARKDDAGLREIRPAIRQGGVDYSVGTVDALSTSYALYTSLLPLDPVAAAWTAANVNANEYGVELVT